MTDFPQIHNTELAGSRIPATDDFIKSRIFTVRGLQVVVDRDLAELYGVQTKVLNQAVKRNANRFPPEFMFVLAKDETEELVTNCDRFASMKHSSVPMRAFSEHGVIMVASVLKSDIAAQISVRITRVFVAMRKALASIAPILMRIDNVEQRQIADRTRNEENQRRNEERFDTILGLWTAATSRRRRCSSRAGTMMHIPLRRNLFARRQRGLSLSMATATRLRWIFFRRRKAASKLLLRPHRR